MSWGGQEVFLIDHTAPCGMGANGPTSSYLPPSSRPVSILKSPASTEGRSCEAWGKASPSKGSAEPTVASAFFWGPGGLGPTNYLFF